MEREPVKAITDSFFPLPHAIMRPKVEIWFYPRLCTLFEPPPPQSPVNPIQSFMSPVSNKPMGDIPIGNH